MEYKDILTVIKRVLKAKRITYGKLSKQLGMSESGIKKIFLAKDCSFRKLAQIAEAIGVPMVDLIEQSNQKTIREMQLTEKQEVELFRNLDCFHFYWKLAIENMSVREIEMEFKLSKSQIKKYLALLDKLGLIVREVDNKITIPDSSLVRWVGQGPLMTFINREWSKKVIEQNLKNENIQGYLHKLKFYLLRPESFREFAYAIERLLDEFSVRSSREKMTSNREDLKPVSLVLGMNPESFINEI